MRFTATMYLTSNRSTLLRFGWSGRNVDKVEMICMHRANSAWGLYGLILNGNIIAVRHGLHFLKVNLRNKTLWHVGIIPRKLRIINRKGRISTTTG